MNMNDILKVINECPNGALNKLTRKDIEKINNKCISYCNFCPFERCNESICGGVHDILLNICYECNKCKIWE